MHVNIKIFLQGARGILRNSELVTHLLNEWRCLDLESMSEQVGISQHMGESAGELLKECESPELAVDC